MRYMIVVKATKDSEAGVLPPQHLLAEMAAYHGGAREGGRARRRLRPAGDLEGLARALPKGASRTVVDGPFAETKELIAGFTIINVKSRAEAVEWTRKFPNPTLDGSNCEIEVGRCSSSRTFGESETLERFRDLGMSGAEKLP